MAEEKIIDGLWYVDLLTIIPSSKSLRMVSTVDLPVHGGPINNKVLLLEQLATLEFSWYLFLNRYLEHQKKTLAKDHEYSNVNSGVSMN